MRVRRPVGDRGRRRRRSAARACGAMPGPPGPVARLVLEYDGSRFSGWARQPGLRTVQAEVERALGIVLRGASPALTVAGRTDRGVNAWAQVASYAGPPAPVAGLNALLPDDVAVIACERAADGFDARADATSRAYCYRILARRGRPALDARRVLHWPHRLDVGRLRACAEALVGTHDFTAFTPTRTEHVRFSRDVFAASWRGVEIGDRPADGALLEFWIEADTFMRHMNRVLVGTMLQVGASRRSLESFVELLTGRPRAEAGPTVPAHGLYLAGVGYDGRRVLSRG